MINRLRILVAMAALSSCAAAIEQRPRFQTVTIARSRATDGGYSGRVHGEPGQPVTLTLQNVSLKFCIQQAFSLQEYQISGPGWIRNARFDITATIAPGTSVTGVWEALRTLLLERWELSVDRDKKEMVVYELAANGDGPKLKPGKGGGSDMKFHPENRVRRTNASGKVRMENSSIAEFAANLSRTTNRPVLDTTGIEGKFDFQLEYANRREISRALEQQLGLKLQPGKKPVDILIVRSALRKPVL